MAAGESTVSVFVPLLILVIIEISQVAREFDLQEIAKRKQEPFFYSVFYLLDRSSQDRISIPQLGPFNFVHGMNLGILFLGYTVTLSTSTGRIQILTGLVVFLFWVLFPMVEVNEYVRIMDDPNVQPVSFLYHSILTTIAAAIILASIRMLDVLGMVDEPIFLVGWIALIVLLYYGSLLGFLNRLELELETTESDLALTEG